MDLSIRMQSRRFARLTSAFSKKLDNNIHELAPYFAFYDFGRIQIRRGSPLEVTKGTTDRLWSLENMVAKIHAMAPEPKARGL